MRDVIALWLVHRTLGGAGVGSRPGGVIELCSWAKHVHQRGGGGLNPPHLTTQPTSCPWATHCLKDVKSIKHG